MNKKYYELFVPTDTGKTDNDLLYLQLHIEQKHKRGKRKSDTVKKHKLLLCKLQHTNYYKPSIYIKYRYNPQTQVYEDTNIIGYDKHSNNQQLLKKYSSKVVRKASNEIFPKKSNYYRRIFDYWWTWI